MLLAVSGSRAYGTHRALSDVDVRGVAVPPARYLHGFASHFEQADATEEVAVFASDLTEQEQAISAQTKLDGSIYDLRKFARLASECNPNILDILFCRDSELRLATPLGERLRASRDAFISVKARHTYAGYAMSQLKRIRSHRAWLLEPPTSEPMRSTFGLPEVSLLPKDQLAAAVAAHEQGLTLDDNLVLAMQRERSFKAAHRYWKQYQGWKKNRNPARAKLEEEHGFDTKHGAHLVRLLRMGREILQTGKVNVWRGDIDADELKAIRAGAWTYDQLVENAEAELVALEQVETSGEVVVPAEVDRNALDALVVELVQAALETQS